MQKQRFELKYLISEDAALMVRDFVRSYLDFDEYSVGKPNYSYPVHSLYLDSDPLQLYWETINGNKNRYKLRLRYYSTHADAPVFFEIKRRVNSCIMKQRGGVRQECVPMLLKGHLPESGHLVSKAPNQLVALQNFCNLTHTIQAKPKVHIFYMREAYVSDDDQVRVTIDRKVYGEANLDYSITTEMKEPALVFPNLVILELKFTNRFPDWFRELVRIFGVMQCGAAKYCECVQGIGFKKLKSLYPVIEEKVRFSRSW
ncbi:MAG TPA: polyphosphate polymerase domain-containing protein [Candidatus Saccharimonadales bacterium]|nr:polyphosphate polymerase domain-containing protein [Candidatus Saccharimonadales bacterium]